MNNDYGRHVHRTWVDTHSQSIRTDPEIYLPGEIAAEDGSSAEDDHDDNNAGNDEGELADVTAGVLSLPSTTLALLPATLASR